jgi:hypothetical protein
VKLDPLLSLAFAVHENPGVYALLLGSGVSRSAGIPTGWEVVIDLIRKLAAMRDERAEPDPARWYQEQFGEDPSYDKLLAAVGRTRAERRDLLRSYFEPTQEEFRQGKKIPQAAHRAIARLVQSGHIKLILTTDFDTLIETALRDAGVEPDVVRSESDFKGARPLVHSARMVVKLHGDYRDDRIKNTPAELARYSPMVNGFLKRVLDEFGLVVCGWSGEYDPGLRDALLGAPSRRYTTYWTVFDELKEPARKVADHRNAVLIKIDDADRFFTQLADKVEAIHATDEPHPLSISAAVASTKNFLIEPRDRIRLEDLVTREVERVKECTEGPEFPVYASEFVEEYRSQLSRYESATQVLCHMIATMAWYDDGPNRHLITRTLDRLAETTRIEGRFNRYLAELKRYPALRVQYVTGITACASNHMTYLRAALLDPVVMADGRRIPLLASLTTPDLLSKDLLTAVGPAKYKDRFTPGSEYMSVSLREVLRLYIPSDEKYQLAFDLFEFILGLVYLDITDGDRAPIGRFGWRRESREPISNLVAKARQDGRSSPLIAAGLFGGDPERFSALVGRYEAHIKRVASHWV